MAKNTVVLDSSDIVVANVHSICDTKDDEIPCDRNAISSGRII